MVHTYTGILFSLNNERILDICNNMHKPRGYYAKWNKAVTKGKYGSQENTTWFHLHKESDIVSVIEAENRMVVAKGWQWKKWETIS